MISNNCSECGYPITEKDFQSNFTIDTIYGLKHLKCPLNIKNTHNNYSSNLKDKIKEKKDNDFDMNNNINNNDDIIHHTYITDTNRGNNILNKSQNNLTPKGNEIKEDKIFNDNPNIIDTNKGNNNNLLSKVYKQLIEMGFDENKSKIASQLAPNDIITAINIASQVNNNTNDNKNINNKKYELLPQQSIKNQFLKFLQINNLEKYFNKFEETESCNLEFVEMFDDNFLCNEIGINNKFVRKRFLSKCEQIKNNIYKFKNNYGINEILYDRLSKYGIITINILCEEIENKSDLKYKYKIKSDNQCDFLWNLIQKVENQNVIQLEGV